LVLSREAGRRGGCEALILLLTRNWWLLGNRASKLRLKPVRFIQIRILGLLAAGETSESILKSYPYLENEDIQEALNYAAFLADERIIGFAS
jgi:hypothetical protein